MYAYCSMCMAWFSGFHAERCALTVVQQSQWRLNELGLGCVLSNFDGTNAFGATRRELLISTAQKAAKENGKIFAADFLQHGSTTLQAKQRGADGLHAGDLHHLLFSQDHASESRAVRQVCTADASFTAFQRASVSTESVPTFVLRNGESS